MTFGFQLRCQVLQPNDFIATLLSYLLLDVQVNQSVSRYMDMTPGHTSSVTFRMFPTASCSQSGRSNFTTAGFFLASPAAGRGAGGGVDILAEGRGIGFALAATTGGVGVLGADVDAVDALDDAVAVFCSLARRFKRIFTNIQSVFAESS